MKYTQPPVPIMDVLCAALKALGADDRFHSVANGHMEVAWRQPSKGRNGEGNRPARYAVTIECGFAPSADEVRFPKVERSAGDAQGDNA